jgi:hypothetical protein
MFGQGMAISALICLIALILVALGLNLLKKHVAKTGYIADRLLQKAMWSSVLRSQIQFFFPTCLATSLYFKDDFSQGLRKDFIPTVKLVLIVGLPVFSQIFLTRNIQKM